MERVTVPRDTTGVFPMPAGHWRSTLRDGRPEITLACPRCGRNGTLADHAIHPDGDVFPSVACDESCGFHAHVFLEGYDGEPGRVA